MNVKLSSSQWESQCRWRRRSRLLYIWELPLLISSTRESLSTLDSRDIKSIFIDAITTNININNNIHWIWLQEKFKKQVFLRIDCLWETYSALIKLYSMSIVHGLMCTVSVKLLTAVQRLTLCEWGPTRGRVKHSHIHSGCNNLQKYIFNSSLKCQQ